jgi:hypothetical protein
MMPVPEGKCAPTADSTTARSMPLASIASANARPVSRARANRVVVQIGGRIQQIRAARAAQRAGQRLRVGDIGDDDLGALRFPLRAGVSAADDHPNFLVGGKQRARDGRAGLARNSCDCKHGLFLVDASGGKSPDDGRKLRLACHASNAWLT